MPVTGQVGMYTPSVERVVKKGDVYTLTVGYLQPTTAWTQATADKDGKPEADKYMIYELKKVKDHYQLKAIRPALRAAPRVRPAGAGRFGRPARRVIKEMRKAPFRESGTGLFWREQITGRSA